MKRYAGGAFLLILVGIGMADSPNMIPSIICLSLGITVMGVAICDTLKH